MAFSHVILSQKSLVNRLPWVTGGALVINLILCFVLIPVLGGIGAAWALLGTEIALAIGYIVATAGFLRRS
jgi:O-antigen/teichoic acid export membrane protein